VNTGAEGSGGGGTFVYSVDNVGDGKVWGLEFDLSTPLTFMGLNDTGVFFNYSWLDSEVTDFAGKRRFNGQSNYVYNIGFIQDLPTWGAAFGVTYRKQGDAKDRLELEEVKTEYGADLEVFLEKRIGKSFVIRLTGTNLLDSSKDEVFDKFDTLSDQADRDYDEYELETERAGPVFQLVARYAF
jgi:outer membrane receptor protein involved in Fe transport